MKLSELYHQKLELLDRFLQKAHSTQDVAARTSFRELASGFQGQAGLIAHCLAYYGDQTIEDMSLQELLEKSELHPCEGENPWTRGLRMIQREFTSAAPI